MKHSARSSRGLEAPRGYSPCSAIPDRQLPAGQGRAARESRTSAAPVARRDRLPAVRRLPVRETRVAFRHPTLSEGFDSWLSDQLHLLAVVLAGLTDHTLLTSVDWKPKTPTKPTASSCGCPRAVQGSSGTDLLHQPTLAARHQKRLGERAGHAALRPVVPGAAVK